MGNLGIQEIKELNRKFYDSHAESFDQSRSRPWKGFEHLFGYITTGKTIKILDLGCGNGRFLQFINTEDKIKEFEYLGLDNSQKLLEVAKASNPNGIFIEQDIFDPDKITHQFNLIVCFGITHHIPSRDFRQQWFKYIERLLLPGGVLCISFWEFKKPAKEQIPELKYYKLEKNDYFLGWKKDFSQLRFCHFFDQKELEQIKNNFKNCELITEFNEEMNKYLIWKKKGRN